MPKEAPRNGSRRQFIKGSTALGIGLAVPAIVPSSALGLGKSVAPSNRIAMGFIGCGGRMTTVLPAFHELADVQPVAVCDVLAARRVDAMQVAGLTAENSYTDFRDLIARDDIDAVAIASPDHWHVPHAIAAIEAGKDVYCEKPLSNTVQEGRALVDAAERYGAVFQHGTQLHSYGTVHKACELVRNGRLGTLHTIVIGSPPGRATGAHPEMQVPEGLNYDLWLGPAPVAPYTQARVFHENGLPGWYFISDYSKAGWIAGFGVHDLDIAHWGMGLERTGPVRIEGHAVYPRDGLFDTALTFRLEYEYANGVKLVMTDTGQNRHGVTFVGDAGQVYVREGIDAQPKSLLRASIGAADVHLPRSPGHVRNFVDCIKSRAQTMAPPEVAHRATSASLIGGIACKLARPLRWDPDSERFIDDPEANRLLSCPMRAPWGV